MEKALFDEFPPITDEQWRQQVLQDLKGAAPETLEWNSPEGITVKPYYRSGGPSLPVPTKPLGPWQIAHYVYIKDTTQANSEALDALQRGATALRFIASTPFNMEALLLDILVEHIQTDWQIPTENAEAVLDELIAIINIRGLVAQEVTGAIIHQPQKIEDYFARYSTQLPGFKLLVVEAVASETLTEQTAQQLAKAQRLVQRLVDAGHQPETVLPHIRFEIAVGTDHFWEIARIRALRALWMVVCQQYATGYTAPAHIHATNQKVLPEKDGYYEMIRQTTQALSAVLGGVDGLGIVAHVATPDRSAAFQARIARNIQLILQHESHLDNIADPAAGSWYLETITQQLAQQAWQRFVALTHNPL